MTEPIKPENWDFKGDNPLSKQVDIWCPTCDGQFWPGDEAVIINPELMVHRGCFDAWARYQLAEGLGSLKT
jgi:hypothetical protein